MIMYLYVKVIDQIKICLNQKREFVFIHIHFTGFRSLLQIQCRIF